MENYLEKLLFDSVKNNTPQYIKDDKIFDYTNKNAFKFRLTKDMVQKLNLLEWFQNYEKEARVSTAGIRGPQNVLYPNDTRFPINTIGITLATLAKALVLKEKYKGKQIVKLVASEVRYNSKIYLDIIARIQAALGIVTLTPTNRQTIPIWLASFLAFKLDLVGAEYITSSHGISVKNATKDLNNQGSQFLPDESMEFVNKIREIFDIIDKTGFYEIEFSASDDKNINEDVMNKLNNGVDLYVEYLKSSVASDLTSIKNFENKIVIDNVGGSAYKTTNKILQKLQIDDKFVWLNVEEDPFFHSIGKTEKIDKNGEHVFYDWSLDVTVSAKNDKNERYFPVIESLKYNEKLKDFPINTVSLITDPDHDRSNIVQILDIKNIDEIEKAGVDYIKLNNDRILAIFSANQAFLMLMDFKFQQLKKQNVLNNHKRFIIKTTPSSKSWDEWAKFNNVEVINTPVGFKEIANVCKKIEKQIENKVEDIKITDIFGKVIHLGSSPRLLFAGEESGGMILGGEDLIESHNKRFAISMREKSASEAILVASNLISFLKSKSLVSHLNEIYQKNNIIAKYDTRIDISYYNESETDIDKLKTEKQKGEEKRTKNSNFYLSLAIGVCQNKLDLKAIIEILSETFLELDFSNLLSVKFVGDGTYLDFDDKFIEIRPSGTDAKTKAYGGGKNKGELEKFASVLGNFDGSMNEKYQKYLDSDFILKVNEISQKIYDNYTKLDENNKIFTFNDYNWLLNL